MTTIKIKGMSCQHCVGSVIKALESLAGVKNVTVDLQSGEASYEGDVKMDAVRQAIVSHGFEIE